MKSSLKDDVSKVKYVAKKFNIITHPTRVQIIELLLEKEKLNVTQIYEKLKLIQAETSLHLGLMKDYGILNKVREGKMSIYSVNKDALETILKISDELSKK
jgi:DNA-binding transcriptional ArsR family regulator